MGYFLKNRVTPAGSSGIVIPVGNTAERPVAPTIGLQRFNTDLDDIEYYSDTGWKTVTTSGAIIYTVDNFTGTGSQTSFSSSNIVATSPTQIQVFVNGLYQIPTTNYTITGNAVVFTSAPPIQAPINVISVSN